MLCPRCDGSLTVTQRNGVEIDMCPKCRGVWLDRGELDKIVDRYSKFDDDDDDDRRDHREAQRPHYRDERNHKRKSFWSELFD
jgi:Zn-finger nucleic acid-binding protein